MGRWCAQCRGRLPSDGRSRHMLPVVFGRSNALTTRPRAARLCRVWARPWAASGSPGHGLARPASSFVGHAIELANLAAFNLVNIEPTQLSAPHFARKEAQVALQNRRARSRMCSRLRGTGFIANPHAMRARRTTVEHPFGTIKPRMGATHFLLLLTWDGLSPAGSHQLCIGAPTQSRRQRERGASGVS